MLRSVDGWDSEHFVFGGAESTLAAAASAITLENGPDGATATIPDAHLLFTAQFSRAGADLILQGEDGKTFAVHDYFATDARARLMSPEGAVLSPHVVAALAGPLAPGQVAQAGPAQANAQAVGRVAQVEGGATIIRNGVAMQANAGDAILKGDVLQTVTGSLGVTFNDGSTLNITANSRLVVNEFIYDSKGSQNSQLLDLVQGSLTFISGEVAHSGDMKIGTPVATMGIRGTVGGVTTANDGTVHFYVSQSATGAVILDSRGAIIANVVQDGPLIVVRPVGPLQVLAEELQKSPAQLATELAALQHIVSIKSVGDQLIQQFFQQNPTNNPNPQSTNGPHTQFQIDLHPSPNGDNHDHDINNNNGDNGVQNFDKATITLPPVDRSNLPTVIEILIPPNQAPVLDAHGASVTYTENGAPIAIDTALTLSDIDSPVIKGARVTISGNFHAGQDVLSFVNHGGITGSFDAATGVLTLTGFASVAAYQEALRSVTYANSSDNPSADVRTISYQADDGSSDSHLSNTVAATVSVTPVNDAPVLDFFHLTIAEGGTTVLSTSDFQITDPDSSNFFFSFANVTGGQFQVFNGSNWVSAPTGGFTVSDIADGHVRFVADGGEIAPTFKVWASDFADAGPAISPTVSFANYVADGTVDASATKASSGHPNEILAGSGIPASHFGLAEQTDVGVELGLQVIYRQGPTVTTTDNYDDGILKFDVAGGSQSTDNGSQSNVANRAAWNFDYSIATGLNGHSGNLSNYAFKLKVDVDSSTATNYHTFEMVPTGTGSTGFAWVDDSVDANGANTINGHPIVIGDDAGTANVAQNSQNYGFGFIKNYLTGAYASNFGGPGQFDIVLEASQNGMVLADNHIQVNVTDVSYVADGTVDASATKASSGHPNEILAGSGIPASHFGLAEQTDVGVELGLQVIYRQGPTVTTTDNYDDGILKFDVAGGSQSTDNGSQSNVANRAAWNFDYSIATGLNGHSGNLSNYAFKLKVDVDSSTATNYHTFEMVPTGTGSTGFAWVDDSVDANGANTINGHPIVIGDDAGTANVAQNSQNYGFGFIKNYLTGAYASNFGGPGQFDIVLEASQNGMVLADNHIQVNVTANPITSGAGNDTLTGSAGADTFVFHANFGHDTVTNYNPTTDYLQFDHTIFADANAVIAATSGTADAVITDVHGDAVTLAGVSTATLQAHTDHILIV